jgi:hypothetical protein
MDGNSPDVFSSIAVWLVLQTASFEAIKDFFGKALAGVRFARH